MTTDTISTKPEPREKKVVYRNAGSAPIYGFGVIGAWVYYLGQATTFWMGALGIVKGIFWPAMLVFELLKYLEM